MRSHTIALLTLCLLQHIAASGQKKADRKVIEQLRADIGYLSSDSLQGRRTGSDGEKKAANYIETRYKQLGIQPYKGKYRYSFTFTYGKEIMPATAIKINNTLLHIGDEAFPLPFSKNKQVYSEILPDVMESGNIWLAPLYADQDEADNPHFDCQKVMYEKTKEAALQGATGILFYDSYGSEYAPEFNRKSEYKTADIPAAFLTYKAWKQYINDNPNDVAARKDNASIPIELDIAVSTPQRTGTNIAAYIDNGARYTVVIGAHYDHLGHGEDGNTLYKGNDHPVFNGADDNASGIAAVLQVAAWVKHKKLHHYNYLFLNFSGEELGLLGSKAFVKNAGLDSSQIACMINIDMVGRLNDSTHTLYVNGIGTSPLWQQIALPYKHFKIMADSSATVPSDHTSFYEANIPVLFLFTGIYHDYHKPSDKADKINYAGEAAVIKYTDNVVARIDSNPKPKFTPTRQHTTTYVNFKASYPIIETRTIAAGR